MGRLQGQQRQGLWGRGMQSARMRSRNQGPAYYIEERTRSKNVQQRKNDTEGNTIDVKTIFC